MGQFGMLAVAILTAVYCGCSVADAQSIVRPRPALLLAQADAAEITFWNSVKDTSNPEELKAYLDSYPNGIFAPLAKIRLRTLSGNQETAAPPQEAEAEKEAEDTKKADETTADPAPATAEIERPAFQEELVTVTLGSWPNFPARSGYLGVRVIRTLQHGADPLTPPIPSRAVIVLKPVGGGPAESAGIVTGNVILAIDGEPVSDEDRLVAILRQYAPGDRITVKIHELAKTKADVLTALRKRAAQGGDHGYSNLVLAHMIRSDDPSEEDMRGAVELLERAADQGSDSAMAWLGVLHGWGEGVAKDPDKAKYWLGKAVDAGNADAMVRLGILYERDDRADKNYDTVFSLYQRAADAGNGYAIRNLAKLYSDGHGVAKDPERAAELYRRAAEMGIIGAMSDIAIAYQSGTGVIRDPVRAADWYNKAAYLGSSYAMHALAGMYDKGTGVRQSSRLAARNLLEAYKADYFRSRDALFEHQSRWSRETRKFVQRYLKAVGTYSGVIDGDIGPGTRKALLAFKETKLILLPPLDREKTVTEKSGTAVPDDDLEDLGELDTLD